MSVESGLFQESKTTQHLCPGMRYENGVNQEISGLKKEEMVSVDFVSKGTRWYVGKCPWRVGETYCFRLKWDGSLEQRDPKASKPHCRYAHLERGEFWLRGGKWVNYIGKEPDSFPSSVKLEVGTITIVEAEGEKLIVLRIRKAGVELALHGVCGSAEEADRVARALKRNYNLDSTCGFAFRFGSNKEAEDLEFLPEQVGVWVKLSKLREHLITKVSEEEIPFAN